MNTHESSENGAQPLDGETTDDQTRITRLTDVLNFILATVAACAIFLIVQLILGNMGSGLFGRGILDADSYARLLRVDQLMSGGGWYDNHVTWGNAPYGFSLHWTRPFDILIALAALLTFIPNQRDAILYGGSIIPVILGVGMVVALVWGSRRYLGSRALILVGLLAGIQPFLSHYFARAYVDHHSLITVLFALGWAGAVRSLDDDSKSFAGSLVLGIAAGVAVWVSVESLLWVLILTGAVAVVWIWEGSPLHVTNLSRIYRSTAAVSAIGFVMERHPREWLVFEADRISLVHVLLVAGLAWTWTKVSRGAFVGDLGLRKRRFGTCFLAFAGPLVAIGAFVPRFFKGPLADVDPRVIPLLFENNAEFEALTFRGPGNTAETLTTMIPALIAIIVCAAWLRSRERVSIRIMTVTLALLLVYVPLSFYQWRWSSYLSVICILPWAFAVGVAWRWTLGEVHDWKTVFRAPIAIVLAGCLATASLSVTLTLEWLYRSKFERRAGATHSSNSSLQKDAAGDGSPRTLEAPVTTKERVPEQPVHCSYTNLGPALAGASGRDPSSLIVMTTLFEAPQLVWDAGVRVIGAPYHRNEQGIVDTDVVMAKPDLGAARSVLDRREADFVVLCRTGGSVQLLSRTAPEGLANRLAVGATPDWLVPIRLPDTVDRSVMAFRIQHFDSGS